VVASEVPKAFEEEGVPVPGHMAALIPFANPHHPSDRGYVLIEPPFNAPLPIVVREGAVHTLQKHAGWKETRVVRLKSTVAGTKIVYERHPEGETPTAEALKSTRLTFHTQRFSNYHNAVTLAMVAVNQTPFIFARNEEGAIDTIVRVHLEKRQVEITRGGVRYPPVAFEKITPGSGWIHSVLSEVEQTDLAKRVHAENIHTVCARIEQVVAHEETLAHLRAWRLASLRKAA
jgi:hypothetical protein